MQKEFEKNKKIMNFYMTMIYGDKFDYSVFQKNYEVCVNRAYRDLSRTLGGVGSYLECKKKAFNLLIKAFTEYFDSKLKKQNEFDVWHKELTYKLIDCFKNYTRTKNTSVGFTVGNAQKWINMTFKYLYTFSTDELNNYFTYCHLALDSYTLNWYKQKVEKANLPNWSLINDYNQYYDIQAKSRNYVAEKYPELTLFQKEFDIWQQYRF